MGLRPGRPSTRPARPWSPACRKPRPGRAVAPSRRRRTWSGGDGEPAGAGAAGGAGQLEHLRLSGDGRLPPAPARRDGDARRPRRGDHRPACRPRLRAAPDDASRRRAARRPMPRVPRRGHPRRPRHDDGGACPRPAAGGDADASIRRPATWSAAPSSRPAPAGLAKKASAERLAPVIAGLMADGPHRAAAARRGAAILGDAGCHQRGGRGRGPAERSSGARSLRGSTAARSIPSQPASRQRLPGYSPPSPRARAVRVRRLHHQPSGLPVGLEVDATDDLLAEQERQHVVADGRLRRRREISNTLSQASSSSYRQVQFRDEDHVLHVAQRIAY